MWRANDGQEGALAASGRLEAGALGRGELQRSSQTRERIFVRSLVDAAL